MNQEQYPLTLDIPQDYATQHYLSYNDDLSPLREFHFTIFLNKDWHAVNQTGDHLPKAGEVEQIGYFKGPGQEPAPRIYIAVTPMDNGQTPAQMMDNLIHQTYDSKSLKILNQRVISSQNVNALDAIIQYKGDDGADYISRYYGYKGQNNLLVILQGECAASDYQKYANDFYMAETSLAFAVYSNE